MSSDELALEYCRTREALKAAERSTRDERAENADAERTFGRLLASSMIRLSIPCIAVTPENLGDERQYVRLVPGPRKPYKISHVSDALRLVENLSRDVSDVASEDLVGAVLKVVQQRARRLAPQSPPPRVRLVAKPAKGTLECQSIPMEVQTQTSRYVNAFFERQNASRPIGLLRKAHKRAEEALKPHVNAPITVQTHDSRGIAKTMRIECSPSDRRLTDDGTSFEASSVRFSPAAESSNGPSSDPPDTFSSTSVVSIKWKDFMAMVEDVLTKDLGAREDLDATLSASVTERLRTGWSTTKGPPTDTKLKTSIVRG